VVKLFVSYSHTDEQLRIAMEKHLSLMKNQGVIDVWHDRSILAGQEFADTIDSNLSDSQIILLLVSSDFLASDYCWGIEMSHAMQKHESGGAHVIPIILRACDWNSAPFGKLTAAPRDGKPIRSWPDLDEALYDVALKIRRAVASIGLVAFSVPKRETMQQTSVRPSQSQSVKSASIAQIYCSRCGASAGKQSVCTGHNTHHDFFKTSKFGADCSRCGVFPGEQTFCTGHNTYHAFVAGGSSPAFCKRCGAFAGTQTTCTGHNTYHDFGSLPT
jgi:TIR domain